MHKPSLTRQTLPKGIAWIAGNAIAILHGKKKNDLLTSDK